MCYYGYRILSPFLVRLTNELINELSCNKVKKLFGDLSPMIGIYIHILESQNLRELKGGEASLL